MEEPLWIRADGTPGWEREKPRKKKRGTMRAPFGWNPARGNARRHTAYRVPRGGREAAQEKRVEPRKNTRAPVPYTAGKSQPGNHRVECSHRAPRCGRKTSPGKRGKCVSSCPVGAWRIQLVDNRGETRPPRAPIRTQTIPGKHGKRAGSCSVDSWKFSA